MNLLNKNSNPAILLAGILSIIISIGIARFAFTSLLPFMLEEYLSLTFAGLLASINFIGYLSGAIFVIFIKDMHKKVTLLRVAILFSILSTLVLSFSTNQTVWIVARIVAGFSSALLFLIASSLVMLKLNFKDKTKAMGIHFSGIGFAIVVSELISQYVLQNATWKEAWFYLSLFSFLSSFYIFHILSFNKQSKKETPKQVLNKSIFSSYVILLILAYFTEGVGFVVQGTFLPDIINSLKGLDGYGNIAWLIVGVAGIPSAIIWMRLAHIYGSINMIMIAMFLQIVGLLIPTFTNNIYCVLLSGALYGSTFIGLVALFMNRAGELAKNNPVVLMGSMTAAYGIGQVLAPLYSIALIEYFRDYNTTLYLTAFIVFVGILFLTYAKHIEKK